MGTEDKKRNRSRRNILPLIFFRAAVLMLLVLPFAASQSAWAELASDSATLSLTIAPFAKVSGLENFSLSYDETKPDGDSGDGDALANYVGSDSFSVESNTPVSITVSVDPFVHSVDSLSTVTNVEAMIDGLPSLSTTPGSTHDGTHAVSVRAKLGVKASSQKSGSYTSTVTITVSDM